MFPDRLREAARDYRFLLNKSYPQKATIKLVGDRYQLSGQERSVLYRGISSEISASERKIKIHGNPGNGPLHIDTYNILFTIGNYLAGRPVYISDDGILRDSGELRGRFGNKKIFEHSMILLESFLTSHSRIEYHFYLDAPVSNSGRLASRISNFLAEHEIKGEAVTVMSPDHELVQQAAGLVCSSDSVIMSGVSTGIFDLPRFILTEHYSPEFEDISGFLE
jgi:hypothetical protein